MEALGEPIMEVSIVLGPQDSKKMPGSFTLRCTTKEILSEGAQELLGSLKEDHKEFFHMR